MSFADIPPRSNGDDIDASWWNLLRTAGLSTSQGVRLIKSYTDFSLAATSNDIEILSLPSNSLLFGILLKHSAAFSGGSVSTATLDLGITGDLTRYVSGFNVFQTVSDSAHILYYGPEIHSFSSDGNSTTSIRARLNTTGDNIDQLTTGALEIYLITSALPTG